MSKRMKAIKEKVESCKLYDFEDAYKILKESSSVKFNETVEIAIKLGVDPRKSDQVVRGATLLPNGNGKQVRVAVFADGEKAEQAKEAGAEIVGMADLAQSIQDGNLDFDVIIAAPEAMVVVSKLGQILGPRGLMPNPKVGTVAQDVGLAVKNAKAGQARYRTDKSGIIHCALGKITFSSDEIKGNLGALLSDLKKAKPSSAKGVYFKKMSISSTMGPGINLVQSSVVI